MRKLIYTLLIVVMVQTTTYFDCGTPSAPPAGSQGGGFNLRFEVTDGVTRWYDSYANGTGQWKREDPADNPQGSIFAIPNPYFNLWSADVVGQVYVTAGRAPAYWTFTENYGYCAGKTTMEAKIPLGYPPEVFLCGPSFFMLPFSVSPGTINTNSVPATVQVTGSGFSSQYGMPRTQYYNPQGTLVAQETATAIASDGTWVTGPTPSNLATQQTGIYEGILQNATAGGGWTTIGAASINLVTPIPYGGSTCSPPSGGCTGGRVWDDTQCRCVIPSA